MSSSIYNLWHQRLGHPEHTRFKLFSHFISNLNTFVNNKPHEICPLAKQARFPFPLSNRNSIAPFDLIHCDIWGNFHTASLLGAHYFLTIVDDYSKCTWLFLMQNKSETRLLLKSFISMLKHNSIGKLKSYVLIMGWSLR